MNKVEKHLPNCPAYRIRNINTTAGAIFLLGIPTGLLIDFALCYYKIENDLAATAAGILISIVGIKVWAEFINYLVQKSLPEDSSKYDEFV